MVKQNTTRLFELMDGDAFTSLEESGGSVYHKTGQRDAFGSILCMSIYNSSPFPVFDAPHWHSRHEKVKVVS